MCVECRGQNCTSRCVALLIFQEIRGVESRDVSPLVEEVCADSFSVLGNIQHFLALLRKTLGKSTPRVSRRLRF